MASNSAPVSSALRAETAPRFLSKGQPLEIRGTTTIGAILAAYGKIAVGTSHVTMDVSLETSMRNDQIPVKVEPVDINRAFKTLAPTDQAAYLEAKAAISAAEKVIAPTLEKAKEFARKRLNGQTREVWTSIGTVTKTSNR